MSAESALIKMAVSTENAEIVVSYWNDIAKMGINLHMMYPIKLKTYHTARKLARLKRAEINYCITRLIKSL